MSEDQTLTYNADVEQVTTAENLNESEQESLEIGEQMVADQDTLLAGKYKDTPELEAAYKELEKKLGEKSSEETTDEEVVEEEEVEDVEPIEDNILDQLWQERNDGFSDETLAALAKKRPGELAKMYLEYRNNAAPPEPQGLNDQQVNQLKEQVGGEAVYQQMTQWAEENLSDEAINMFDSVMDKGDPASCFFAVEAMKSRYQDSVGSDGNLITGKAPSNVGSTFQSQPEVVAAMSDPRYDADPAYRREIMDKLERSNIEF